MDSQAAKSCKPVDVRVVGAVAALLHPAAHGSVLRAALVFLQQAVAVGNYDDRTWRGPLFLLAPLLSNLPASPSTPVFCPRSPLRSLSSASHASGMAHPHACTSHLSASSSSDTNLSQATESCCISGCCSCSDLSSAQRLAAPPSASGHSSICCALDTSVLEAPLQLLLDLSDHTRLRGAVFAAGCVEPLLKLLSHTSSSVCVPAACILANMVEHPLSLQQLCKEAEVMRLLNLLDSTRCTEVTVGKHLLLACNLAILFCCLWAACAHAAP